MVTRYAYTVFLFLIVLERLFELVLSKRNIRKALETGGVESGAGHYPFMVLLHVGLLAGSLAEVWLLDRVFIPWLGFPMLGLALLAQFIRYWVIRTLGWRWNTRVVVIPGLPRIRSGPYRFTSHPNYVAVVLEGFAIPLVHTNWITAALFSGANAMLLAVRIRTEERALADAERNLDQ